MLAGKQGHSPNTRGGLGRKSGGRFDKLRGWPLEDAGVVSDSDLNVSNDFVAYRQFVKYCS